MSNKSKVVVLGLVRNDQDEVLLTQRSDPKVPAAHLLWDLPGGTVEFGEEPEQTVVREVQEETGLTVKVGSLIPVVASQVWQHDEYQFHAIVLAYECSYQSGEITLDDEKIAKCEWVPIAKLSQLKFLATTERFIQYILSETR